MRANRGRIIIASAVLILVLVILVVGALARAGTQAGRPLAPAQASTVPALRDQGVATPTAPPAKGQAEAAAIAFVQAYSSQSWQDPEPTSWVSRAALHATDDFARQLRQLHTEATGSGWGRFVESRSVRSARVDYVDAQLAGPEGALVAVRYQVTTTTDGADPSSLPIAKLLGVRLVDGQWRINFMSDLAAGYAPATPDSTTVPTQAPTIAD